MLLHNDIERKTKSRHNIGMKLKLKKFICGVNNMAIFIALHKYFPSLKAGYVLRILLLPIYIFYYLYRQIFVPSDSKEYKHQLGLCLIIKDEAPAIEEWIKYHHHIGVDIFYIFDNGSKDNLVEVLKPYVDSGLVIYQELLGRGRQLDAYNLCLRKYKKDTKYIGFIDADEFIYTKDEPLISLIERAFENKKCGGLALNWVIFGSNGLKEKDNRPVIERFTKRSNYDFEHNQNVKTIVNPRKVLASVNPHFVAYVRRYKTYSINNEVISSSSYTNTLNMDKFHINHYYCKSREEYVEKCSRGLADQTRVRDDIFNLLDKNDVVDESMLKYCEFVK